ncbi:TPA: 50S ribosomal protein L23 [Patescibacteria group bacterium]|nr:50S ribosomal protein L23 [Patescibacteria group bacterium]|tara:strand:- start:98 stop:379 length:282 start_codon:yes stop_codon:yes gene_type:complete
MNNKFLVKNPLITEKGTDLSALGKYLFLVDKKATKNEIKKIVEKEYKVKVTKVNVMNTKPKPRRLGRSQGYRPGYKKAVVTLAKDQKIDVVPQ